MHAEVHGAPSMRHTVAQSGRHKQEWRPEKEPKQPAGDETSVNLCNMPSSQDYVYTQVGRSQGTMHLRNTSSQGSLWKVNSQAANATAEIRNDGERSICESSTSNTWPGLGLKDRQSHSLLPTVRSAWKDRGGSNSKTEDDLTVSKQSRLTCS